MAGDFPVKEKDLLVLTDCYTPGIDLDDFIQHPQQPWQVTITCDLQVQQLNLRKCDSVTNRRLAAQVFESREPGRLLDPSVLWCYTTF